MKININDYNDGVYYMPLFKSVLSDLVICHSHTTIVHALMLAMQWFESPDKDINFDIAAQAASERTGLPLELCRDEIKDAFDKIASSVIRWVRKREVSKSRSEAGKRGMESRWRGGKG